ncbi:PEP-CTERM sorting domain-containing protein [Coraliomargarita algicola]|uniref:PEP-CTERM sorting domain-containing protein n=1 Tax=Coraliomargarita algicola TaxID=3092156 RepID=A0ABZ0RL05_9BACT|nr:PEP-CTERM sorting domain-containing protein [Coraliomargarita sp. J2-16]WPJ96885.1 PEP-CTERM sorting domain-containing protein [Coraliomargarita sp. J2-16]
MKATTLALTATYLLTTAYVSGALIYSESFDTPPYSAGDDLDGQQGWSGVSGYIDNNIVVDATGLSHSAVSNASGGSIRGINDPVFTDGDEGILTHTSVGVDSNLGTGTQYWFSALLSLTGNGNSAERNVVTLNFDSGSSSNIAFGLESSGAGGVGTSDGYSFVYGTKSNFNSNMSGAGYVGTQYVGGSTVLVVGRMTVVDELASSGTENGKEILDFWINPSNFSTVETMISSAQGTLQSQEHSIIYGDWGQVTVGLEFNGSGGENTEYLQDEIRVGTSLADLGLTTIPEPSSAALLMGLVAIAGLCVRRRG